MLIVGSAFKGYTIEATDGRFGTVKTFLFDDTSWKIRWVVIDTGNWLPGRLVLVHPSAIGQPDHERQTLPVNLTKAKIEASPDLAQDQPVTMQMQNHLYSYYGWDPYWGPNFYGAGLVSGLGMTGGFPMASHTPRERATDSHTLQLGTDDGDPHLRSMTSLRGYHIHASDGSIGHVENFLLDDATWAIRYLIVDTRNWWPGAHVLISPFAVKSISWDDHEIRLNVSREQVKSSPSWEPAQIIDDMYERRLHTHYGWPGYGW
jgi:hypothetical protein